MTPTTFRNVQDTLGGNYRVVRPDNWFQLLRQASGLPIEPIEPITGGRYRLVSKASGLCVEPGGAGTGVAVRQSVCNDSDAQLWDVTATGNGYVRITAAIDDTQSIEVSGGGDGAPALLGSYLGGPHQQWQPVWQISGHYHLLARHSDKCFDVPGGSTEADLALQQWACNNADAQAFAILPPSPPPMPPPDAGAGDDDAGEPDAGDDDPPADGGDAGGGCCSAAGGAPVDAVPAAALLLLLGGFRRRRAR